MKHLAALNKYFVKYKWRLMLGIIFVAVANLLAVLPPQVIRYLIDLVNNAIPAGKTFHHHPRHIGFINVFFNWMNNFSVIEEVAAGGVLLLLMALLRGVFMFFQRQTLIVMSRYIEYDLKNEVYTHYQLLDLNFFKMHNTGDLMSRITEDVSRVRMYVGPALMYSVNMIVLIVMTIYTMLSVNVELTLYTLAPLPVLAVTIYYVNQIIHRKGEKIQAQLSAVTTQAQESYSGIRVIKSYVQENDMERAFDNASELYKLSSVDLAKTQAIYFPAMSLMIGLSTLITILIGGLEAINGTISVGSIAEFVVYINMLTWPVSSIGFVTAMIQRASASQKRLNEFLDTRPTILTPEKAKEINVNGHIEFKNVSFTYPHTGIKALKNFNLEIKSGEKIAIIGRTGAGKSTLAQLLIRMYDPDSGSILIDGVDIRRLSLKNLRSQLSYVPQDVFLFSDTIINNIKFGLPDATDEEAKLAARQAHIAKEIEELPEGFQTRVGERGVTLSGGQKQRISIARALIKDPKLVVFDDCLSAVDAKTEKEIISNLYDFLKGKTAIIITHRIFSLFEFDKVVVLDNGAIIEQGTHEQLIEQQGYYAELYARQQLQEKEEVEG